MAVTKWFLKVSKYYPLNAKHANFQHIYMKLFLLKICPTIITAHGKQC